MKTKSNQLILTALILALAPIRTALGSPDPWDNVPANTIKTWTWPANQGVKMKYVVNSAGMGMDIGNYYFKNLNSYPVAITWTVRMTYADGFTKTLPGVKGPINVRAGGSTRTGWGGDGDVITVKDHGLPATISCPRFKVVNRAAPQQEQQPYQQSAPDQQQTYQQQGALQRQQQELQREQQQLEEQRRQLQEQLDRQKAKYKRKEQAIYARGVSKANADIAAGQAASRAINQIGQVMVQQIQQNDAQQDEDELHQQQRDVQIRQLAETGDPRSQLALGVMYYLGQDVPQDYGQALKWYSKAAIHGEVDAQNNLGVMYRDGKGVPKDYGQSVKWFRKAAEQGDPVAQYNLGAMYENGRGVPRDLTEALKWYRKAADQENKNAKAAVRRLTRTPLIRRIFHGL